MTRTFFLLICLLLAPALTGCPKGDASKTGDAKTGKADSTPTGDGADSPADLWTKLSEAAKAEDFDMHDMAKYCTRDSQEFMMVPYMFMAGFAMMAKKDDEKKAVEKEMNEIFEKHGLKKEELEKKEKGKKGASLNDPEGMVKELKPKLAGCTDLPALYADLGAFLDKLADKGKKKKLMDRAPEGELKDLKEEGDTASGEVTWKKKSGKTVTERLYMKKVDGLWYLDIIASEKAKKAAKAVKTGK